MSTDLIVVKQLPVIEEQLRTVKMTIQNRVNAVLSMECTEDTYREIKKARADLNAEFRELESRRKAVKTQVEAPYKAFEKVYKDCAADIYAQADRELAEKIYAVEGGLRRQKAAAVQAYFSEYRDSLHLPADIASYDFAGINVTLTASEKSLKKQAKDYLDRIREDLTLIDTLPDRDEVLAEYRKCMSVSKAVQAVRDRHARIEAERQRRLEAEEAARKTQEHTAEVEQVIAEEEELAVPEPAEAPADEFHAPVVEPDSEENAAEEAPAEPEVTPANRFAVSFRVVGTIDQLKAMKKFLIDGGYEYEQLD